MSFHVEFLAIKVSTTILDFNYLKMGLLIAKLATCNRLLENVIRERTNNMDISSPNYIFYL